MVSLDEHPIGMSRARLAMTAVNALETRGASAAVDDDEVVAAVVGDRVDIGREVGMLVAGAT